MKDTLINDAVSLIDKILGKTGPTLTAYFNETLEVDLKKDLSPVTKADKETELTMREMIGSVFPDHGIIGEEYDSINENAEYVWVLDPIDGTKSFISGVPIFGSLIAVLENRKPVIGVIHLPILNEVYLGIKGRETTLNKSPVQLRGVEEIDKATFLCTDHLEALRYLNPENFQKLAGQVQLYRNWGDCYMYTLLVKGKVDIVMDPVMNFWDIQALIPVVEGAGGVITSCKGEAPEEADSILAASKTLHNQALNILNG